MAKDVAGTNMTTNDTKAITIYTQDDYRRLCERLNDDTVAALLHISVPLPPTATGKG